jgi:phage baseplate assembly protein W
MLTEEEVIRDAIFTLLKTAKGGRVIQPDFVCGIWDLVFETINPKTLGLVEIMVREALMLHEPRMEVIEVRVSDESRDMGRLLISIDYRVKSTKNRYNLILPFVLH